MPLHAALFLPGCQSGSSEKECVALTRGVNCGRFRGREAVRAPGRSDVRGHRGRGGQLGSQVVTSARDGPCSEHPK